MKKLLLSSIIMFAICSVANAQNATGDSKLQKAAAQTNSISPNIQKAAVTTEVKATEVPSKATSTDQQAAVTPTNVKATSKIKVKPAEVSAVNAEGVLIAPDAAKKQEVQKIKNN